MRHSIFAPLALSLALVLPACSGGGDAKDGPKKLDGKAKVAKEDEKGPAKPGGKVDAKVDDEPKTPATPEAIATWFQTCWSYWSKDWDAFGQCYAEDAVSIDGMGETRGRDAILAKAKGMSSAFTEAHGDLQLTLVSGTNVVAVARVGGKHTAPMKLGAMEIPATNKTYGVLMGHVVQTDEAGAEIVEEWTYFDGGALMGQLGLSPAPHRAIVDKDWAERPTVIAKNDDLEKKNVEAHKAFITAFNAHDIEAIGDALADDATWSEQSTPGDMDKKTFLQGLPEMFKAFSDTKLVVDTTWGAGDYVVSTGKWTGTNDGDAEAMGLRKTGKKVSVPYLEVTHFEGGKIATNWLFYDGMAFALQLGLAPPPGGLGDSAAIAGAPADAKGDAKAEEK